MTTSSVRSTVPPVGLVTPVTVSVSPVSTSVSLPRRLAVTSVAVSSMTVASSSPATGSSLTQVRSIVTVPVVEPPSPSRPCSRSWPRRRRTGWRGGEGDRARVERDGAARRVADAGDGRRAVVGVGVVGSEVAVSDHDVGVLGARGIVVAGDRVVVDAGDVDRDVAGVGAACRRRPRSRSRPVVAAEVGVGVKVTTSSVEVDGAAGGVGDAGDGERVARRRRCRCPGGRGDVGRGVLGDRRVVVARDRVVVDAGEVDRDRAGGGAAVAVLDRVVEAGRVVAAQVGVGDEGDRARDERTVPPDGLPTSVTAGVRRRRRSRWPGARWSAIVTSVSSVPEASSSPATGSSLTHVMFHPTCPASPPWPSEIV